MKNKLKVHMTNYVGLGRLSEQLPLGEATLKDILKEINVPWIHMKTQENQMELVIQRDYLDKLQTSINQLAVKV